jgi:hypothetical protein
MWKHLFLPLEGGTYTGKQKAQESTEIKREVEYKNEML